MLAGVFGTAATGYILQRGKTHQLHSLEAIALLVYFLFIFYFFCLLVSSLSFISENSFSAGSWDDVFKVAVVLYIIGTLVWNLFATGERVLE